MTMSKAELQAKCDSLGIKYQDNDTVEQLELMIAGEVSKAAIKQLEEDKAKLAKANTSLEEANKKLLEHNKKVQEQLEEVRNAPVKEVVNRYPTVKVKKITYEVLHGLDIDGKVMKPAELAKDVALCERLIEKGSGALRPKANV